MREGGNIVRCFYWVLFKFCGSFFWIPACAGMAAAEGEVAFLEVPQNKTHAIDLKKEKFVLENKNQFLPVANFKNKKTAIKN